MENRSVNIYIYIYISTFNIQHTNYITSNRRLLSLNVCAQYKKETYESVFLYVHVQTQNVPKFLEMALLYL